MSESRIVRLHLDWMRRYGMRRRPSTSDVRTCRLSQILPVPLFEATEQHLEDWQSGLSAELSIQSPATYTSHVRSFYLWAVEAGHREDSPARRLPVPKVPKRLPRPIPEQDLALAMACADEPMRTRLVLAGCLGLRANEIATVTREGIREVGDRLVVAGVGKGNKPFVLPVPREVVPFSSAPRPCSLGPVVAHAGGAPATGRLITKQTMAFFKRIGMPYTMHTLRHRFGTEFYRLGRDAIATQHAMRHSSLNTTMGYVVADGSQLRQARDELSGPLRAARGVPDSSEVVPIRRGHLRPA